MLMPEEAALPAAPAAPPRSPMRIPWRSMVLAAVATVLCLAAVAAAAFLSGTLILPEAGAGGERRLSPRLGQFALRRIRSYDDLMATVTQGGVHVVQPGVQFAGSQFDTRVNPVVANIAPPPQTAATGFQLCRNPAAPSGGCCQQILSHCCEAHARDDPAKRFTLCFNPATQMLYVKCDDVCQSCFGLLMAESLGTTDVAWHGRWENYTGGQEEGERRLAGHYKHKKKKKCDHCNVQDFVAYRFQNNQPLARAPLLRYTPLR